MRQQAAARWAMSQIEIQTETPQKFTEQHDLAQMESWLNDELRCESPHDPTTDGANDSGCTVTVTHRIYGCTHGGMICASRAEHKSAQMLRGVVCLDCKRLASECWKIIPI
jgi:hypothetical protein